MKMKLSLPPTTNIAYRVAYNRRERYSYMYMTKKGTVWKEEVQYKLCRHKPKDGEFKVVLNFYLPNNRRDIDGMIKLTLDALEGKVYKNDRQVMSLLVYKNFDKENPRLELQAYQIE